MIDEACLHHRTIDDAKDLLDVAKSRDITCRNRDGRIPAGTPRIFSTNWGYEGFFPPDARLSLHEEAIRRRVLWVAVDSDLRVTFRNIPNGHENAEEDEMDVFGHGGGLG